MRVWPAVVALWACGPRASDPQVATDGDGLPPGADVRLGDLRWRVPGTVDALAFLAADDRLVVGSIDGGVVVFDVPSGRRRTRIADLGEVASLARLDDDHVVVAGTIRVGDETRLGPPAVVDVARGRVDHRPGLSRLAASEVAASDDGRELVVGAPRVRLQVVGPGGEPRRELDRSRGYRALRVVGDRIVAVRPAATIGIWDRSTGARLRVFAAGVGASVAALSRDGNRLAAGAWIEGNDWVIDVYRTDDGAKIASIAHPCSPGAIAFSPDGSRLAVGCAEGAWIHAIPLGTAVATLAPTGAWVRTMAWSPGGRWLALGGSDHAVHLWDTATWRRAPMGDGGLGPARWLDVTADGRVVAPHEHDADVWDLAGDHRLIRGGDGKLLAIAVDGETVVLASEVLGGSTAVVVERRRPGAVPVSTTLYDAGFEGVSRIAARPDGHVVVVAGRSVRVLGPDLVEQWTSGELTAPEPDLVSTPAAAITRDGGLAAIDTEDGAIQILDLDARMSRQRIPAGVCGGINRLAFTGDRQRLLAAGSDGALYRVDLREGRVVAAIELPDTPAAITWLPSGEVLALVDGVVHAWDRDGAVRAVAVRDAVTIAAAPDGRHVYVGLADGTILRYRWPALRDRMQPIAARPPTTCDPEGPPLLGGLLGSAVEDEPPVPRGMLDNTEPHEDPINAE